MPYKKYNSSNNAIAALNLPLSDTDLTMVLKGNYWRFPTSNFIVKITKVVAGVVTRRENIYVTTRTGATCTGLTRAYEAVPNNDSAATNVQQALEFDADDIVEVVISAEIIKDMQEEILNKYSNDIFDKRSVAIGNPSNYADYTNYEPEFRPQQVGDGAWYVWIPWMDWIVTWWTILTYASLDSWAYTTQVAYSNLVAAGNSDVYMFIRRGINDTTWGTWKQVFPLDLSSVSELITAPAWESILSTDAITLERLTAWTTSPFFSATMWNTAANNRVSQTIMGNWVWFTTLNLILVKSWAPTDTTTFTIETDDGTWKPSGTAVTNWTQTLVGTSMSTSWTDTTITFPWTVTLTSGTRYHLVWKRQNAADWVNYYNIGTYWMNTRFSTRNLYNASWGTPTTTTGIFMMRTNGIFMNIAVKATAAFQSLANVDWFSQAAYTLGQTVSIYRSIAVLSGLTKDALYSLSDTAWVISTTPWTIKTTVWYALSSTALKFAPVYKNALEEYAAIRLYSANTSGLTRRFIFNDNGTFIFSYSHDSSTGASYVIFKNWVQQLNIAPWGNSSNTYNISFAPWDVILFYANRSSGVWMTITLSRTLPFLNMIDLWA